MKVLPIKIDSSTNGYHPQATPGVLKRTTLRYLNASLKRQWKRYRKGLRRCQDRFSEAAVHESRVETRRLLSLLELLRPLLRRGQVNRAQAALKGHLDTFDDLRDTQVQLPAVRKMRRQFPAAEAFHDYLTKREERFNRGTRANIKCIRTRRLGKTIATCRAEVKNWRANTSAEAVNTLLLQSVDAAFARAVELRKEILPTHTETIHRTRVAFKKLRYMIEILAEHLSGVDEKLLSAMHRYQTMMGDIQDAEVLLRTFDKFLLKKSIDLADARRFRRELLRRRQWLIRVYLDAADQLLEFWHSAPANRKLVVAPRGTRPRPRPATPPRVERRVSASKSQSR